MENKSHVPVTTNQKVSKDSAAADHPLADPSEKNTHNIPQLANSVGHESHDAHIFAQN